MFLKNFYTWEVKWASGEADMDSALQLLIIHASHDAESVSALPGMHYKNGSIGHAEHGQLL